MEQRPVQLGLDASLRTCLCAPPGEEERRKNLQRCCCWMGQSGSGTDAAAAHSYLHCPIAAVARCPHPASGRGHCSTVLCSPGPRRNRRRNARPPAFPPSPWPPSPHSPLLLSLCQRKFALALIVFWPVDSPVLYCHTLLYFKNTHCCRGRFLVLSIPQTGPRAGRWRQRPERTCSPYPPRWPLSFPVTVEFSLCLPQRGSPPA